MAQVAQKLELDSVDNQEEVFPVTVLCQAAFAYSRNSVRHHENPQTSGC